jgi:LmbE family N-acetylglucosaminyl deacetylase
LKIAVVSPHGEDAGLSLGLAIGVWLQQGHAVEVVSCFTRSEHAPFSDADSVHANDRMSFVTALRRREAEDWRRQYRSAKLTITDLNLKDARLRLHCAAEDVTSIAVNEADKAFAKIHTALERSRAGAVVFPLALGGHADHRTAMLAAAAPVGTMAVAFYEDLPDAAAAEAAIEEQTRTVAEAMSTQLVPVFAGDPVDVSAAETSKRRQALCFVSQLEDAQVELVAGFCTGYGGRERLWANPAWLVSFPETRTA